MKCLLFSLQINDRWIILQILTLDHQILFWTIKKKKIAITLSVWYLFYQ